MGETIEDRWLRLAPIKIGWLGMEWARFEREIRMAFDEGIERGVLDRRYEFLFEDDAGLPQGTAKGGIDAFNRLVDAGCLAVVGANYTDSALALAEHANARKVPLVSMCGTDAFHGEYCFRLGNGDAACATGGSSSQASSSRPTTADPARTAGASPYAVGSMAFGQQSGPPASAKQVQELLTLLQEAGHADFRDARGPMGFTQRQANGKFTREEAGAFIDQLHEAADGNDERVDAPQPVRLTAAEQALRRVPTEQLAAELQRRGWIVIEP